MSATFNRVSLVLLKEIGFRARNPKFLELVTGFSGATAGINAFSAAE